MFTVRTIQPDQDRVEVTSYDLTPTNKQGKAVCSLFLEFLSDRPAEFRERSAVCGRGRRHRVRSSRSETDP